MNYSFHLLLALFLIYAFLGWCAEVMYATLEKGKFVNRGFLSGPACPIYGVGVVIVLLLLEPLKDNLLILFIGSIILTSTVEFVTGFILEKFFHQKWWDYKDEPFNIKGYISLKFSLIWGIACVLVVNIVHPLILKLILFLPTPLVVAFLIAAFGSLIVDMVFTIKAMLRIKQRIKIELKLEEILKKESHLIGENLSDGVLTLMKLYEKTFKGKNAVAERLGRAFVGLEKFKEKNRELLEKIKSLNDK